MSRDWTQTQRRVDLLRKCLSERILVLDGAMGTAIQSHSLLAKDFGGDEFEGCNENLVLTRPDIITQIHESHLQVGADIVETDTFGGTPLVLAEFQLASKTQEINIAAAQIARQAAEKYSTSEKPRFVAGSIGPTTKAISVTGGITFDELLIQFYEQAKALGEGGVDYFLVETSQDTRNVKAAILGIQRWLAESGAPIPIAVSGTVEPMGTLLAGQTIDAFAASLSHCNLLYLGLNCATGPEFMTDHVRVLSQMAPWPVACVPNAGLPDENGNYLETPKMMSQVLNHFIENGWINLIGGCCGTRKDHTEEFAKLVQGKKPRTVPALNQSILSGLELLEITDDVRPVVVGERTNVIGSRKFKELIVGEDFESAAEVGRAQVKKGAQILDACLANPDREELADMERFMDRLIRKIKVPIMIDSTDEKVVERALTYCQGKAIINSINLEDGEERFEKIVPLAKKYGAALVVGTIDDDPQQGMGVTRERKLEIARREFDLLTQKYEVSPYDIYWDPLVFPCGTGDENYKGAAPETIEAIRLLKKAFPGTKTVLGISNISFGLPNSGREVLNSVFLYHCVQSGLDLAIVNAQKLERYATLSDVDKQVCDDLLYNKGLDPVAVFAKHFRGRVAEKAAKPKAQSLDERLAFYIIEGSKDGLTADLELKLKESPPLEIINGPLMKGMDEVGRLFNGNKLIVAEVLQSAEAMKAAVAFLEPFMDKKDTSSRGKVLLATVKGDVHDIGKNLVEIILANNGFHVVNLGIKVPPDQIISAIAREKPDLLGLSGLLVKSAQQMVITATDLAQAGIQTPMLVGGAALTESFVDKQIAKAYSTGTVAYASSAMAGLDLAKMVVEPGKFHQLKSDLAFKRASYAQVGVSDASAAPAEVKKERSKAVPILSDIPKPEDLERHVLIGKTPIEQIWNYMNPMMVFGRHLGIHGNSVRLLPQIGRDPKLRRHVEEVDPKAFEIWSAVEATKEKYRETEVLKPVAVYQFLRSRSFENTLAFFDPTGVRVLGEIEFPRQAVAPHLCLSDFVSPDLEQGDTVGAFVVSVGRGVREEAERLKNAGDYLRSHILQVIALESAEAYAEYLHGQMRRMWGFPDPAKMTMLERFQAKYHGKRYSFGYPACPQLSDQVMLFQMLSPAMIGVELTEGFMMEPEASVSALVFHHSAASYFTIGKGALAGEQNRADQ
ncbi:MAG: methionine synthase [Deltaproteobacteria bacterium]|nr:methionine synthase [Deltaproteobacteria bacterium]MBI3293564.1 methionine synthase [Deltaproteobacteria bacterium]